MTQLQKGILVEIEHRKTYDWIISLLEKAQIPSELEFYKRIASDHLNEFENYYDALEVMEETLKEEKV